MVVYMTTELFAAFIAFAFVASVTPGPNNLMLMASGANFGVLRTLPHLLGVSGGFTLMIALIGLGFTRLFEAFPASLVILKFASVAYLLYLAWRVATAAPSSAHNGASEGEATQAQPLNFWQAAAFQWVNPKAWAMAITAIGAYTQPEKLLLSVAFVALVFGAVNLPTITLWMTAGAQLRRFLSSPLRLRVFNIVAGVLLAATAAPIMFAGKV